MFENVRAGPSSLVASRAEEPQWKVLGTGRANRRPANRLPSAASIMRRSGCSPLRLDCTGKAFFFHQVCCRSSDRVPRLPKGRCHEWPEGRARRDCRPRARRADGRPAPDDGALLRGAKHNSRRTIRRLAAAIVGSVLREFPMLSRPLLVGCESLQLSFRP